MSALVSLPKGVTVHVRGQKYKGEIPANVCPKKYLKDDKSAAPRTPKSDPKPEGS